MAVFWSQRVPVNGNALLVVDLDNDGRQVRQWGWNGVANIHRRT